MLINLSNHPSSYWSDKQLNMAKGCYENVIDLPFPAIEPDADDIEISRIADEYTERIIYLLKTIIKNNAVHLMGEMALTFALVIRLQKHNITCVCSTSKRISYFDENNIKHSKFEFVRFREYELVPK